MARPVALVSGSPAKLAATAGHYGIAAQACHAYEHFEKLADDPAVEAVAIILPNAMHREFAERAAAIGKPVLCEKPMATSLADAQAMEAACAAAGVPLMIAYRIHFEPFHQRLRAIVASGRFGRMVGMTLVNVQTVAADAERQWRHVRAMSGGGALPDIGLYLVNSARYLAGADVEDVWATSHSPAGDDRFAQVEETMAFTLRFPGGTLAQCLTSYGAREDKYARVHFEQATVEITNAYAYAGQRMTIEAREGDHVVRSEVILPRVNQFAAEIDHFAQCLRGDGTVATPGAMGVRDHAVMEALYESARSHRPVAPRYPAPAADLAGETA